MVHRNLTLGTPPSSVVPGIFVHITAQSHGRGLLRMPPKTPSNATSVLLNIFIGWCEASPAHEDKRTEHVGQRGWDRDTDISYVNLIPRNG